jgi:hypothetical protein
MEHYVTLFDSLFLPQGLALHMSMERHVKDYTLWILCVDDEAHGVLTKLKLPNVSLLQLGKLETEELLRVKPTRSNGEYCWTLTPFAPRFVFEADPNVERVTYLDADLWFRKNPKSIFDEFDASGKQVLITDHAYAPEYDQSATSGQYCVQFMTFTRYGGEVVRKWWEVRCIEWCYARFEDGKFGDQKYLDDWPVMFADYVHVLENKEALLAPWNAKRFPYSGSIIWHFQELRIINGNSVMLCKGYEIPASTKKEVYEKYLKDVSLGIRIMSDVGVINKIQSTQWVAIELVAGWLKGFFRKLRQLATFSVRKM